MRVCRKFKFDAAHYLPNYNGVCSRLHGHTWYLEVEFEGPVSGVAGFVADFADIKKYVSERVIDRLDHQCLNDVACTNPTCENLLKWIWERLDSPKPPRLSRLRLYESLDSYAETTDGKES